jgi:hypothetical protein
VMVGTHWSCGRLCLVDIRRGGVSAGKGMVGVMIVVIVRGDEMGREMDVIQFEGLDRCGNAWVVSNK